MNNEEWHQWRKEGIGSSDAAVIVGTSPWKTRHELWQEKVYDNTVQLDNSSMMRGRELEPVARTWFENRMNVSVFPQNRVHANTSWIRASLDGINMKGDVLVEIKCPNKQDHLGAIHKQIPEKYWPQVQHQLLVTGLDGMYYCSFDGIDGAIVEVARDNAYIQSMLEEEQKFWDMVLAKTPPPLTDRDFLDMSADKQWQFMEENWRATRNFLKKAEEQEEEARNLMISHTGHKNAKGNSVRISKSVQQGAIDWQRAIESYKARLTALYPTIELPELEVETFRKKPFTKWTFRDIADK